MGGGGGTSQGRRIEHLARVLSSLLQQAIGSTVLYYLAFLFTNLVENIRYSLKTIRKDIFLFEKCLSWSKSNYILSERLRDHVDQLLEYVGEWHFLGRVEKTTT